MAAASVAMLTLVALAQGPEVYSATALATQAVSGGSARVVIRLAGYTSDAEKEKLVQAFKQPDQEIGLTLLRSMSKGFISVEGQSGRKIEAAFLVPGRNGNRMVLLCEHELSKLEISRGAKQSDFPLAVVHLQFDRDGAPLGGELFPAAKLAVTSDGFVDIQTNDLNKVVLIDVTRQR